MSVRPVRLWSDEPSPVDLLAFGAVAETAVEAVLDDTLDPIALGVSGPWGSGKSTVLRLIESDLKQRSTPHENEQILVVQSDPWRYDPSVGAKATLISEVLTALQEELKRKGGASEKAQNLLKKLAKRVNWVKALKVAARSSITLQLPNLDDLSGLINEESVDGDEGESKTLDEFRTEFAELLNDDALVHVKRVVVLVDDLDRCLPETVVETLETMRLFLSVPKMSFVIAADEDRVADALRDRYPRSEPSDEEEEPARLYLHKIVQTTLKLPALSRFDTEAYLLLLQLQNRPQADLSPDAFADILSGCTELRTKAGSLDDLRVPTGLDITGERQFATRLTPILYEKLRGSPRRVKRFLNDLNVRASIARRRGIELDIAVVAKLMVLELLLRDGFNKVLDWLARGELRDRLAELERLAGRVDSGPSTEQEAVAAESKDNVETPKASKKTAASKTPQEAPKEKTEEFSDNFVRWAKLPPPMASIDLSPYLHLAASFGSTPLIDIGLPERLRDIAANLLSSSRIEQKAVTDDDLRALGGTDAVTLIEHLGRIARDRPTEMSRAVGGILRITNVVPAAVNNAEKALKGLPVADIRPPVILLFRGKPATQFAAVLSDWSSRTSDQPLKNAIAGLATQGAS
ncbi:KAP family P-loop NTPase fold protein [Mycobacterium palustre]|uniref:KAP family P-loop NTPase fold protein n=1 Tax=Mycobacterium palustre TaxID=153971 RepID=UPI001FE87299|nr:P-loop NTPase fold protein [Mycobacterium palustre]